MADGKIVIAVDADAKQAQKELASVQKRIETIEARIQKANTMRSPLVEQAAQLSVELDKANAKLLEMQNSGASTTSIAAQKETVAALQAQYNQVQSRVEAYDRQLQSANYDLEQAKQKAGELTERVTDVEKAARGMAKATEKTNKSMSTFGKRLGAVIRSALVFTVITQALAKLRTWLGDVIQSNRDAAAEVANLKGALLTLAPPILSVLVPAFTAFLRILTQIVSALASFVSLLFGKTVAESKKAAEKMNEEAKAIGGVGGEAKKATKQLAAFDEINRLVKDTASGGSGGGSISPNFNFDEVGLQNWLKNLKADLSLKINSLKLEWDKGNILKNKDAWIIGLSAILGAILGSMFGGFTGGVIGLVLGAVIGLVGCTLLDKTDNPEKYKKMAIPVLAGLIGAALGFKIGGISGAVIGLLMGLSIGLIALDFTEGKFEKWKSSDTFLTVLSAILGAVLGGVFGGVKGAVLGLVLGATIGIKFLNWANDLENPGKAKGEFQIVISALLGGIIGTIFGGVAGGAIGLALGLAIGFVSVQFNDDVDAATKNKATSALCTLLTALIGALIGAALGGPVGAIVGGVVGVTLGLAVHWGSITMDDVKVGGKTINPGHSNTSGKFYSAIPQSLRLNNIPMLATGAVIPPNREFMAVLGDQTSGNNIEAPESLIRKIVREETSGSGRLETLLQTLIDITREGKTLELDGVAFAKVTKRSLNNNARAYGVPIKG